MICGMIEIVWMSIYALRFLGVQRLSLNGKWRRASWIVSHPYVSRHATVQAPPTRHPPTAMDLTWRVAMARARVRSVLLQGYGSLSDWSYVEAVLSNAQPPRIGPLGAAYEFLSIYERDESSRASAADTEADKREAQRLESVVIAAKRPGISIRDPPLPEAPRVELSKARGKRPATELDQDDEFSDDGDLSH
ncbi:hypothetical protein V2J09_004386 [Rumex salicifolius]